MLRAQKNKSKTMKLNIFNKTIRLLIISNLFVSCLDEKINSTLITKDYYLKWVYEKSNQTLLKSKDDGKSGRIEIGETVFAVGFNDNFIIAKQHPNKEEEISERLFGKSDEIEGYLLENPNDTVYLAKDDSIHKKNGKWYHLSNGWNPADSLKPYKKITNYYIIDLKTEKKYSLLNKKEFEQKRIELGIPKNLEFTIIENELK